MDKKESFLNLMQEQKQICEKCYLWDNDGCYCASDGRNTEVCEFFNRIDALYPDSPSPEMVCPECHGDKWHTVNGFPVDCDLCHGTGKVPSPELPPEKVRHEIAKHLTGMNNKTYPYESYLNQADFIILKLQQAGWGDTIDLKSQIVNLQTELTNEHSHYQADLEDKQARIKELDSRIVLLLDELEDADNKKKQAKAEARQQALKEVGEWLESHKTYHYATDPHGQRKEDSYSIFLRDWRKAVETLKQGELPKE